MYPQQQQSSRHRRKPRCLTIKPEDTAFNRVVRLEGQIITAVEILRYRLRYSPFLDGPPRLYRGMEGYFSVIEDLLEYFLGAGLDLAAARSQDELVRMMNQGIFAGMSAELRAQPHWWSMIRWHLQLQKILENERKSIQDALIEGWYHYMTYDGLTWWDGQFVEHQDVWDSLSRAQQKRYLENFSISREILEGAEAEIRTFNLEHPKIAEIEANGCRSEFAALRGLHLLEDAQRVDTNHPQLNKPCENEVSACPICLEELRKEQINTHSEHRPVKTTCGHVFGYSCVMEWFPRHAGCPMCRRSFTFSSNHTYSAEGVLRAYDQRMRWWSPPPNIQLPQEPHSYLNKLALVFEPADAVRRHFARFPFSIKRLNEEHADLVRRLRYIARDRLAAALSGDAERYRSVVREQAHLHARRFWINFLNHWHPSCTKWVWICE